jgi:hypothetical protein
MTDGLMRFTSQLIFIKRESYQANASKFHSMPPFVRRTRDPALFTLANISPGYVQRISDFETVKASCNRFIRSGWTTHLMGLNQNVSRGME